MNACGTDLWLSLKGVWEEEAGLTGSLPSLLWEGKDEGENWRYVGETEKKIGG